MEIFARPATAYVAGFIGAPAMNFLPATLEAGGTVARLAGGHSLTLTQSYGAPAVTIGIRPENVVPATDGLPVTVDLVEPLGSETLVHGHLEDGTPLMVKQSGAMPVGETLYVALPPAALHVFDAADGKRLGPN
jgi:sn-glycerol 3-phosphate transport system ATP-binding protein